MRLLITFVLALCTAACEVEPRPGSARARADSGRLTVEWRSEPTPIPLNEPFELFVRVTDDTGNLPPEASLSVEGWMPDHGHGMLRQPVASLQPDGWFRVQGMLFHMAGDWELRTRVGWRAEVGDHFEIRSRVANFEVHL